MILLRPATVLLIGILILSISTARAQKNFLEVPSVEIVEAQKLFVQAQVVFSPDDVNAMAGFTYGLPKNFEIGLSFNQFDFKREGGLEVDQEHPEQSPDVLLNAQKVFNLSDRMKAGIGIRTGVNGIGREADLRFANFNYANCRLAVGPHAIVGGAYYTNCSYAGAGSHFGVLAGLDVLLVKDRLHFVSDYLSGTSALSIINAGLEIEVTDTWSVIFGAQFPNPGTDNAYGGVLQVSWN